MDWLCTVFEKNDWRIIMPLPIMRITSQRSTAIISKSYTISTHWLNCHWTAAFYGVASMKKQFQLHTNRNTFTQAQRCWYCLRFIYGQLSSHISMACDGVVIQSLKRVENSFAYPHADTFIELRIFEWYLSERNEYFENGEIRCSITNLFITLNCTFWTKWKWMSC